ncbi:MAG: hypothetical protein P1Q69_17405, partial [Candidatus Thorarchaeota archaeon]|nr:hypothetical protein [Candidatus Thorarchaeota archaeon]
VFAVFPDKLGVRMGTMLENLKNGLHYYPGFHKRTRPFGTQMNFINYPIKDDDRTSYQEQVKTKLLNLQRDYPSKEGDVYLIILPDNETIYHELKDFAVSRNLKTQMLQERTLGSLQSGPYTLYCFALSLCVAAGITPWIVDSSYFDGADCYIGLAFAKQESRGRSKFFLGVADVFDSFGEHLSFALHDGKVSPKVKGLHVDRKFMSELVSKAILRYDDKMDAAPETIVIHKPGSFHYDETAGVADALLEWESERAFLVHIQHNNLFRAYNPQLDYYPVATTYFRIGPGNAIVFPTGYLESSDTDHKMGTPKPVQLNVKEVGATNIIERKIADNDLHFILQNYLAFTRLRWSSLSPRIRDPLTIHAPRVIAEWQGKGIAGLDGIDVRDIM